MSNYKMSNFIKNLKEKLKEEKKAAGIGINNTIEYGIQTFNNTVPNQVGGAFISVKREWKSPGDALAYFLNNANVIIRNPNSLSGRIAIFTLPDDVPSPYTEYSAESLINPTAGNIRSIILKFALVRGGRSNRNILVSAPDGRKAGDARNHFIKLEQWSDFNREAIRQQQIACQTANDDKDGRYEMATPYIVYTTTGSKPPGGMVRPKDQYGINLNLDYPNQDSAIEKVLVDFLKSSKVGRSWPDFINLATKGFTDGSENFALNVGVIAMTLINSDQIQQIQQKPKPLNLEREQLYQLYMVPVIYELIRVAVWCELLHTDLHRGNYFVLPTERRVVGVQEHLKYKALLIDWGNLETIEGVKGPAMRLKELWNGYSSRRTSSTARGDDDDDVKLYHDMSSLVDLIYKILSDLKDGANNTLITLKLALYGGQQDYDHEHDYGKAQKEQFIRFLAHYHKGCQKASNENEREVKKIWEGSGGAPSLLRAQEYFEMKNRGINEKLQGVSKEFTVAGPSLPESSSNRGETWKDKSVEWSGTPAAQAMAAPAVVHHEPAMGQQAKTASNWDNSAEGGSHIITRHAMTGGRKKKTKKALRGSSTARAWQARRKTLKNNKKHHRKLRKTRRS